MQYELKCGDSAVVLKEYPDNHFDSVVTDPPYGIDFMGKSWDGDLPMIDLWKEVYRVLKPGGHLISFFGTKTYHRGVVAIEDSGFEIRDMVLFMFGTGFPKSHDISKKLQKRGSLEYQGWETALKPAFEPIVLARKPLSEKSVADNVLVWGTGAINIEACRPNGRFPANVITDGSHEVSSLFPETNGESVTRFWYTTKASVKDKEEGLDDFDPKHTAAAEFRPNHMEKAEAGETTGNPYGRWVKRKNIHPTVKPTDLMQYLCRLVTPPGGLVLDPFMGSGSTGKACAREGFRFVGIDMTKEYVDIAEARIKHEYEKREIEESLLDFLN